MEAGDFEMVFEILRDYDAPPYFHAKSVLFQAMARHRQERFQEAVYYYDVFLTEHVENMPPKERTYAKEYARFFRSRAASKIDPSTPLYLSVEELRELAAAAPPLTRNEFKI